MNVLLLSNANHNLFMLKNRSLERTINNLMCVQLKKEKKCGHLLENLELFNNLSVDYE